MLYLLCLAPYNFKVNTVTGYWLIASIKKSFFFFPISFRWLKSLFKFMDEILRVTRFLRCYHIQEPTRLDGAHEEIQQYWSLGMKVTAVIIWWLFLKLNLKKKKCLKYFLFLTFKYFCLTFHRWYFCKKFVISHSNVHALYMCDISFQTVIFKKIGVCFYLFFKVIVYSVPVTFLGTHSSARRKQSTCSLGLFLFVRKETQAKKYGKILNGCNVFYWKYIYFCLF